MSLRHIIESQFGLVLLCACAVGLVFPGLQHVPDASASIALAMLTYASCFKLRDGGFADIQWRHIIVFYIARYTLLPLALLTLAHMVIPHYAMGVFLLALLPTAVSSPAFAQLFGGRVPPAFAIVIISTLLAPLLIPLMFYLLGEPGISPSPAPLFRTLALCIFTPMAFYYATRRFQKWGNTMYANVKLISIVLVAFVIALVIAKQREVILGDLPALITPLGCTIAINIMFIAAGLWLGKTQPRDTQITYATCSGFSNVALGVSLALLHFPPHIILLVAVSEIAWAMLPMLMKTMLKIQFRRS